MPNPRNRHLLLSDALLLPLAALVGFALRFEGTAWPAGTLAVLALFVAVATPAKLLAMWGVGLYSRLWRHAGVRDLEILCRAAIAATACAAVVGILVTPLLHVALQRVPLSVIAVDALLSCVAIAAPRVLHRMRGQRSPRKAQAGKRVVVAGAGAAGSLIVRELLSTRHIDTVPVAFVDDDPRKQGHHMQGVPVAGTLRDMSRVVRDTEADEVIIAMPSAPGTVVRQIVDEAAAIGVPTRTMPALYELIDGRKSVSRLRDVAIEDLLRREPVKTDLARVRTLAEGRTVMITGAGGSIGSELCRQIAQLDPDRIVALGRGENSVFEMLHSLKHAFPDVRVEPVIADIRDAGRLETVFAAMRPATVFHAAAHKHVPLMEQNVGEAVLNNVYGTRVVATMASRFGAERFVLISSDKAVRPSSVMGATKRLAEGVLQSIGETSRCRFISVRFGNVLGSRGSVIPTFLRQMRNGGPLTLTHPEMQRYFMTIPEAVQLVLQAGAMGEGGEVFVLDMGQPVRIVDLARDLIRLSGLVEGRDVEIAFTGMRPGEKLYEELFFNSENASPTVHPKVLRARNASLESGETSLDQLIDLARANVPADELRHAIHALVPEYTGAPTHAPAPVLAQAGGTVMDLRRRVARPAGLVLVS